MSYFTHVVAKALMVGAFENGWQGAYPNLRNSLLLLQPALTFLFPVLVLVLACMAMALTDPSPLGVISENFFFLMMGFYVNQARSRAHFRNGVKNRIYLAYQL